MKTYAELIERRKTLVVRSQVILDTFIRDSTTLADDTIALQKAKDEFDQVYGYLAIEDDDGEHTITINLRQPITDELVKAVKQIDGVADTSVLDRYTLEIVKGAAFGWSEIRNKFDEAYGKMVDPIIIAAELANKTDVAEGDESLADAAFQASADAIKH